jgi:hypothetical protein
MSAVKVAEKITRHIGLTLVRLSNIKFKFLLAKKRRPFHAPLYRFI